MKKILGLLFLISSFSAAAKDTDTIGYWNVSVNDKIIYEFSYGLGFGFEPVIHIAKYAETDIIKFEMFTDIGVQWGAWNLLLKDSQNHLLAEHTNGIDSSKISSRSNQDPNDYSRKGYIEFSVGYLKRLFLEYKIPKIVVSHFTKFGSEYRKEPFLDEKILTIQND